MTHSSSIMAATDNKAPPIVTHTEAIELLKTKIKPTINNKWDALFIFIHAVLEANGFKLVGLGEEDNLVGTHVFMNLAVHRL